MYYHDTSTLGDWVQQDGEAWNALFEGEGHIVQEIANPRLPLLARWRGDIHICRLNTCAGRQPDAIQAQAKTTSISCGDDTLLRQRTPRAGESTSSATKDDSSVSSTSRLLTTDQTQNYVECATDLPSALEVPHPLSQSPDCNAVPPSNGHSYPNVLVQGPATAHFGDRFETNIYNGTPAAQVGATCLVSGVIIGGAICKAVTSPGNTSAPNRPDAADTVSGTSRTEITAYEISDSPNSTFFSCPETPAPPKVAAGLKQIFGGTHGGYSDDDEKTIVDLDAKDGCNEGTLADQDTEDGCDEGTLADQDTEDGCDVTTLSDSTSEATAMDDAFSTVSASNDLPPDYGPLARGIFEVMSPDWKDSVQVLNGQLDTSADACLIIESAARTLPSYKGLRKEGSSAVASVAGHVFWPPGTIRLNLKCLRTHLLMRLDAYVVSDVHWSSWPALILSEKVIMRHHLICTRWICWNKIRRRMFIRLVSAKSTARKVLNHVAASATPKLTPHQTST